MSKTLKQNVTVGGVNYGPDYPANEVTSEVLSQITNEAVFSDPDDGHGNDLRTRADDFGTDEPPNLAEQQAAQAEENQAAESKRQSAAAKRQAAATAPSES